LFSALRHRNFRLLWIGLLISFSGSLMQSAAILWHVSLLVPDNRRALALGMVGLVRVVPVVGFSLLSGVAADVYDRRKLMLFTQTLMAAFAAALAILTWRGLDAVWPIYALAAAGAAAGAFDMPARQALTPNLVPREHLANALTLNTIMFQVAAVAGPAAGGLIIARLGVAWTYAFNAVSFLVVIAALGMMSGGGGGGGGGVGGGGGGGGARAPEVGGRGSRRPHSRCTRRWKGCGSSSARRSSDRRC
jgi:MFS family permease